MKRITMPGLLVGTLLLNGCFSPLNVKYIDKEISKYKAGNVVSMGQGSVVGSVLAIEMMKQGKFVIAGGDQKANYSFRVNALYSPQAVKISMPATYSFSVVTTTGEIIYIKAIAGGDMKNEFAQTLTELAGLLL